MPKQKKIFDNLELDKLQAALASVVAQKFQDSGITVSRGTDKPNTIIITAKQEIGRIIFDTPTSHEIIMPQLPPEYDQTKFEQEMNKVILNFKQEHSVFLVPKFDDVSSRSNKSQKLQHKKNIEKILDTRYTNAKINQLKKIIHASRTRRK